ncbi:peptidase M10 [Lacibacter luteus]|uniref:Peptidase M10 n=1 Tax=Lacibacter luteus TaxID=2508719 RepID=A0A4Q1CNE2_9BACT|nr:peptidase M10 [Lacibacter luteus]RXK62590.1 peptidase M10 [Lacibacter luteus]
MALAQLIQSSKQLIIFSHFHIYGDVANETIAKNIGDDIACHWNEPNASIKYKDDWYKLIFDIKAVYNPQLKPEDVWYNTDPKLFFFRIEEYSPLDISFVDGIGSNTGFFKLANLLQTSTTAAHEYGHMLGLVHPKDLDIRGAGIPGIMYPRGTICDPQFQYNPVVTAGTNGGTLDPRHRKVCMHDIELLKLHKLRFNERGFAVLGDFTSIYHPKYEAAK